MSNITTLAAIRDPAPQQQMMSAPVTAGFFDLQSFELMQRVSKMFASSNIVPESYRSVIEKLDRYGNVKESRENPRALANCAVALSMAQRMNADPMMVMQNLHIIEGRPSWSSQWIIAAVNSCGRFSPLHFEIEDKGQCDVEYVETYWEGKERRTRTKKITVHNKICTAWATEKATGDRIESPPVSIEIAVKEGWYGRNGSKWQTMPDMMLRYRSAAFFGKLYAPEILMGLSTAEEAHDIIDVSRQDDGGYAVATDATPRTVTDLNARLAASVEIMPQTMASEHQDQSESAPAASNHESSRHTSSAPDDKQDGAATEWPKADPETGELVNAHGIPWDERFHSSTKACNDNGTWRRKRGCDPELADRYEREALFARQQQAIDLTPSDQQPTEEGGGEPEIDQSAKTDDFTKCLAGLRDAANEDELIDWLEFSRECVISKSQRLALEAARDERRRQLNAQAG